MHKTITMTTKGTFTLPVSMRQKLGINSKGDKLAIVLDEANQRVIISKPTDLSSIHKELKPYVQAKQPLSDVSGHYTARKPRI